GSSAPAALCGWSWTTETMRYFTDHGLAHRMAPPPRARQAPHRRRALAARDAPARVPAAHAEAAPARAALPRRERFRRRPWPGGHRRHAPLDRRAGVPADTRARARLVCRLARDRRLSRRLSRAPARDRRGRRGA